MIDFILGVATGITISYFFAWVPGKAAELVKGFFAKK